VLKVENLYVRAGGREVLRGVWLEVGEGETHIIMGPNASGKTSLAMAIMGHPAYEIMRGKVLFQGTDITGLSMPERVKLGIGLAFQNPPAIRGVKVRDVLAACAGLKPEASREDVVSGLLEAVGLEPELYLRRDLNLGFSGGEKKRMELAQLLAMRPKLAILDEPDSGVDVDSLKLIGSRIAELARRPGCATIIITHYRHILSYVEADTIHIMYDGRVVFSGEPGPVLELVEEKGYEGFVKEVVKRVA